jgi:hypothetical protein
MSAASPVRRARTRGTVGRDAAAAPGLASGLAAARLGRRRFDRLRLRFAVTLDGDAAAFAVGDRVGARRSGRWRVFPAFVTTPAVKAPAQRLLLLTFGRTPGMAHRLSFPLAVTFCLAGR